MSEMTSRIAALSGVLCIVFYSRLSLQQQVPQGQPGRELMEYCQWEIFNATCDVDEVVLLTHAKYGRMQFGRCVREDHGSNGCSANVLMHLDQICSGRRSCHLSIPDATLHSIHPCPKELMPYLEASYSCISVHTGSSQFCTTLGSFSFDAQGYGYLASATAVETSVGLSQCPWLIEVKKGQRINLTLYSFSTVFDQLTVGRRVSECDWTLVIQEGNVTVQLPGCSLTAREKVVYTSQGSQVKVHLEASDGMELSETSNIILKYQVFGCPDLPGSVSTVVKRHGDTTMVTCVGTGLTDVLTCFNDRWMGEVTNCSKGSTLKLGEVDKGNSFPYGMLLVVGIGILMGIILGVIMLFGIILCLRRRREKRLRSQTTDPLLQKPGETDADAHSTIYFQRHPDNISTGSLCAYHHLKHYQGRHHHCHHVHQHHHSPDDILAQNADVTIDVRSTPFPLCVVDASTANECAYESWMTSSSPRLGSAHSNMAQTTFISDTPVQVNTQAPSAGTPIADCPHSPLVLDLVRSARSSKVCPRHQIQT